MNKRLISILRYLVFAGLGGLLLYFAYRNIDLVELWQGIREANFLLISISVVMGYLAIVSRGMRWLLLIDPLGYKANTWNSIHSVNLGYFANFFLPRSGEVARCVALSRTDDIPVDKLFGTVIMERVVDFCVLIVFLAVAFFTHIPEFKSLSEKMNLDIFSTTGILLGLISVAILLILFRIFRNQLKESKVYRAIVKFLSGMKDGLKSIFRMKKVGLFMFHTAFIWGMYYFMAYIVFFAIPETQNFTLANGLFIVVAGGLGMVFPAPGGTGSYQFAVKLGFIALGLSETVGLKFATIVWSAQNLMMIGTGLIATLALFLVRRKKAKLTKELGATA